MDPVSVVAGRGRCTVCLAYGWWSNFAVGGWGGSWGFSSYAGISVVRGMISVADTVIILSWSWNHWKVFWRNSILWVVWLCTTASTLSSLVCWTSALGSFSVLTWIWERWSIMRIRQLRWRAIPLCSLIFSMYWNRAGTIIYKSLPLFSRYCLSARPWPFVANICPTPRRLFSRSSVYGKYNFHLRFGWKFSLSP